MPRSGSVALRFFELALVLVRFIHVASRIVTANRSLVLLWNILRLAVTQTLKERAFEFTLPLRDAGG